MTPLSEGQRAGIIRRLAFLEVELGDLEAYAGLSEPEYRSDRKARRDVERLAENIVNAYIDVAKIVLAGEDRTVPATYREAVSDLAVVGFIKESDAAVLADFTRLRNVLAHQYLDIRWSVLKRFLAEAPASVKALIQAGEDAAGAGDG